MYWFLHINTAIPYTDTAGEEHYKAGKDSNKKFMLSKLIDARKRKTNVSFPTSAQTVSSVGIFLHCISCCWPRLLYAQKKIQASDLDTLKHALNGFQLICGMSLQEIIPKTLKYWVGVQWGQSYLMGRRSLFSLGWPLF